MVTEYELIPTKRKRGTRYPQGWVHMAPGMNTKRWTLTEGYLLQRMPRTNTIDCNQNYVERVLNNPCTPEYNRKFIIRFVYDHPEKFLPFYDKTDDPVINEWARNKNADARPGWIQWLRDRYGAVIQD